MNVPARAAMRGSAAKLLSPPDASGDDNDGDQSNAPAVVEGVVSGSAVKRLAAVTDDAPTATLELRAASDAAWPKFAPMGSNTFPPSVPVSAI